MSKLNTVLAEPLTLGQETIRHGSGKALLVFSLLIGFISAVFLHPVLFARSEVETPAINMRGAFSAASASPMSMSCPRQPPVSVNAMQQTLRKLGVPPSPMEKFALTSFAATRDVSLAAHVKEEFSKLDTETQAKLKKLERDVVVRASTLSPEDMAGVTEPLGFWDPAGFAKQAQSDKRPFYDLAGYRRAELKHGRVCMQASLGIIVADLFHPIFDAWGDGEFVSATASHFTPTASQNFWPAFWLMTTFHEVTTSLSDYDGKDELFAIGPYWDPLGLKPEDPEALRELENKELNNGRLAMFAAAGAIVQELISGKPVLPPIGR